MAKNKVSYTVKGTATAVGQQLVHSQNSPGKGKDLLSKHISALQLFFSLFLQINFHAAHFHLSTSHTTDLTCSFHLLVCVYFDYFVINKLLYLVYPCVIFVPV